MLRSGRYVALFLLLLLFVDNWEPSRAWRRRRRRRPPPCPYVCTAKNAPVNTNPFKLTIGGAGVCLLGEYRSEQYCKPCHCGSCPAYRSQAIQVYRCCQGLRQSGSTCPIKIPCGSPEDIQNGERSPSKASFAVGEKVTYTCNTHYQANRGTQLTCLLGPRWSANAPDCLPIPCTNPPVPVHAAISGGARGKYAVGTSVTMVCQTGYRRVSGSVARTCNLGNRWTGYDIVCKPVCAGNVYTCKNGGKCDRPEFCIECNEGFYSPKCDACPKIVNCDLSVCSYPDPNGSKTCKTCSYDFGNEGGRAYEPSPDKKTCLKRCSWRADSNYCYPGECGLVDTCKCAIGFSSPATQCNKIIEHPRINPGFLILHYGGGLEGQPSRINVTRSMIGGGRLYTNAKIIKHIDIKISGNYLKNLPQAPPFIVTVSVGLKAFSMSFKLHHKSGIVDILSTSPSMVEPTGVLRRVYQVDQTVNISKSCGGSFCELSSNDRFHFATVAENGGFVTVRNPETKTDSKKIITGVTSDREIEISVDHETPEHCSKTQASCGEPLTLQPAGSTITNKPIKVTWTGWKDAISGVGNVHLTVSEMQVSAKGLLDIAHGGEHMYHWSKEIEKGTLSEDIVLPSDKTAVYEIKAVICDLVIEKLKNCKATRRFILRDSGTKVSTTSTPMRLADQVANGKDLWITKNSGDLTMHWKDHFQNDVYQTKSLLNQIKGWPINGEDPFYDHHRGPRNISQVQNIRGITRFQAQVKVRKLGTSDFVPLDHSSWQDIGRTLSKKFTYNPELGYVDGESAQFFVEATDFVGHKKVDLLTIHFDSSPPVIGNISLVKGGRTGINVHTARELFKAKFRFHARDIHSGIFTVKWTLYDNFTRTDIIHGTKHVDRQKYSTITECKTAHPTSNCYSTGMSGVFADLFEFQLNKGDLADGLDLTQHDHDLQFKVTVENNALLKTEETFQISIDTTGPHPGHVLNGVFGSPEVDFQSSLEVKGHWKDFYDKESGIAFYKYKFGTQCYTINSFSLANKDDETLHDYATWTAPGPGKYHLTVVAYNNGLEPSVPVCSNDIMIDSIPPVISSVVVEKMRTRPGLLKDSGNHLWLVDGDRRRLAINDASTACLKVASSLPANEIALLPMKTFKHSRTPKKHLTDAECQKIGGFNKISVLSSDSLLNVSFTATDKQSGVEDVSVALVLALEDGSPVSGTEEWISSHGTNRVILRHPDIRHGARVFIKIRARDRAQQQIIQAIGPVIINVRAPVVSDNLNVERNGTFVWLSWKKNSIVDSVSPYPLELSFSAGRTLTATDLIKVTGITSYPKCPGKENCFIVDMKDIPVVSGKMIYFRLHVVNVAGHRVLLNSLPFQWVQFSGSSGILRIIDVNSEIEHVQLSKPISCQSNVESIKLAWFGFHLSERVVSSTVVIYDKSTKLSLKQQVVDLKDENVTINHLTLKEDQSYYAHLTVTTAYGSVFAESLPVKIMKSKRVFSDLTITLGDGCITPESCKPTIMQASTSHVHVAWTNVAALQALHPRIIVGLVLLSKGEKWTPLMSRTIASSTQKGFTFNQLSLPSGRVIRGTLQFCVDSVCSAVHTSSSMWISVDSPATGTIEASLIGGDKIEFSVEKFELRGFELSQHTTYMTAYDWRIQSIKEDGTRDMAWSRLSPSGSNTTHMFGEIPLPGNVSSTSCVEFVVRGRTIAGITSSVKQAIGTCANGGKNFRPHVVIDAKGPLSYGEGNFEWSHSDIDYLIEGGDLAVVWPTLRHGSFQYAILQSPWSFRGGFFATDDTKLTKPCDHKDAIFCGTTKNRYMNANASAITLRVDKRYHVCIHANRTVRGRGSGREVLEPVSACSDGVTIISNIPKPGTVTAGPLWSSSTSRLKLRWTGFFSDSVAAGLPHNTIVTEYFYKIGTSSKGNDVLRYTSAGLDQEKTVSGLTLFNMEKYYVTVKAVNLVGVVAETTSRPVGIDLQPPTLVRPKSFVVENSNKEYLTDVSMVRLRWTGVFEDGESGLCSYQWCIGSSKGLCDVKKPKTTRDSFTSENLNVYLHHGNSYYFGLRAFDCVGHSTLYTSSAYYVVKRGPQAGQVFDGESGPDLDYQDKSDRISAHWSGFADPQSDIVEYKVHVSSMRGAGDIIKDISVGLHRSITFTHLELRYGVRYYFGVTACNRAGLCVTRESDGLVIDQTPPVMGKVLDGNKDQVTMFQHSRSTVQFQLVGFADLESGLSILEWCLTKTGTECDVSPRVRMPFESVIRATLRSPMPTGTLIRVKVVVYNHVEMATNALSLGFTIDESPPVFVSPVTFDLSQFSWSTATQIAATRLALKWNVVDQQSGIWEQFVHVKAHSSSEEVSKMIRLPGFSIGTFTLTKLSLRDGYRYQAKITACNRAGRCTTSQSTEVSVDNSPPQGGMFLPRTNASFVHEGAREMTWDTKRVTLSWQGFSDGHSGVDEYIISIGTAYLSDDLLKTTTVPHVTTKREQKNSFTLLKPINAGTTIFISLRAVNGVKLKSHLLHSAFIAAADKNLDIIRRCTAENCLGHCVCAPLHQSCAPTSSCNDLTGKVGSRPTLIVKDTVILGSSQDADFTTERCIYSAAWTVSKAGVRRFEISAGLYSFNTPKGLFNKVSERVWFDVGQDQHAVLNFTQRSDKCMQENVKYKFFVRAWYDSKTFAQFTSNGITPVISKPQVNLLKGSKMWEANPSSPNTDIDIIPSGLNQMMIQWPRQFKERHPGTIKSYSLALGTICGGTEIVKFDSTKTSHLFSDIEFQHGREYIASILACDVGGLCSLACSDGARADFTKPIGGLVVNSLTGLTNNVYQRNQTHVSASWLEFTDPETSIASFDWCIGSPGSLSDCTYVNWRTMGLHTHARTTVSLGKPLEHGDKVVSRVRAQNPAGPSSSVTVSGQNLIVDTKPPFLIGACKATDGFVVKNNIFSQFAGTSIRLEKLDRTWWKKTTSTVREWSLTASSQAQIVESVFSHTGNYFVLVRGSLTQTLTTKIGQVYSVEFQVADVNNLSEQTTKRGHVKIGDLTSHSFSLQARKATSDHLSWVKKFYHFKAKSTTTLLQIGTLGLDNEGLGFDSVVLKVCASTATSVIDSSLTVSAEQVDDQVRVHASWAAHDDLSGLAAVKWALGTVSGGVQLQPYTHVDARNSIVQTALFTVPQKTPLHFSLLLVDRAGTASLHNAVSVRTDFSAPAIVFGVTGKSCSGTCVIHGGRFEMSVSATDEESGIARCNIALGSTPRTDDISAYQLLEPDSGKNTLVRDIPFNIKAVNGRIVYPTIVCVNSRGVSTTKTLEEGIRLVTEAPSSARAFVRIVTPSKTHFPRVNSFQSDQNQMVFTYDKFADNSGSDYFFEYSLEGPSGSLYKKSWQRLAESRIRLVILEGLNLVDGATYKLSVRAVNLAGLVSDPVSTNVTIDNQPPSANKGSFSISRLTSNEVTLDWTSVFKTKSSSSLFYEVSVGTGVGKSDIFGLIETRKTTMTLKMLNPVITYHFIVTAISNSGLFTQQTILFRDGHLI